MTEVVWSDRARSDLRSIADFIVSDSPHYAELVVEHLLQAVERLAHFPQSGRVVPELGDPALREVIWQSYRIVYRYEGPASPVGIVTVFRSERQFPDLRHSSDLA